jgi:hypothetical protein
VRNACVWQAPTPVLCPAYMLAGWGGNRCRRGRVLWYAVWVYGTVLIGTVDEAHPDLACACVTCSRLLAVNVGAQ